MNDNKQTTPLTTTPPLKANRRRPAIYLAIVVLVIVSGVAVYLGYKHLHNKRTNLAPASANIAVLPAVSHKYSYGKLQTFSVRGGSSGMGASFQVPIELQPLSKTTVTSSQGQFIHFAGPHNQSPYLAEVAIVSVAKTKSVQVFLDQLKTVSSEDKSFAGVVRPIKTFVDQREIPNYQGAVFETFKALRTPNIKSNAMVANFTDTSKDPSQTTSSKANQPEPVFAKTAIAKLPELKGQATVILGKNAFYYFFVSSVAENWQPNAQIWQQVINSLKIDQ